VLGHACVQNASILRDRHSHVLVRYKEAQRKSKPAQAPAWGKPTQNYTSLLGIRQSQAKPVHICACRQFSPTRPFVPLSVESLGRLGEPDVSLLGSLADAAVQAGGPGLSHLVSSWGLFGSSACPLPWQRIAVLFGLVRFLGSLWSGWVARVVPALD
jgi:hypothetical protein